MRMQYTDKKEPEATMLQLQQLPGSEDTTHEQFTQEATIEPKSPDKPKKKRVGPRLIVNIYNT